MNSEEVVAPKRQKILTMVVAVLVTFTLLFYMVTFQVRFFEKAVVTTFGNPTTPISEPGLYWKWPYPFQNVYKFDGRIQILSGKLEQLFTSDKKSVIIASYIGWRIHDPIKFLKRAGSFEEAENKLEGLTKSYVSAVVSKYPFSNLISLDRNNIKFGDMETRVLTLLNEGEDKIGEDGQIKIPGVIESLGLKVEVFGLKTLNLPENTTKEVFNRMKAERERKAEEYRSRGEGIAKEITAGAEAEKQKLLIEAKAKAKEIRGEADAIAADYYKTFAKNPELATWLRKLDSLEKVLSDKATLILDTKTPPFDLLQSPEVSQPITTNSNATPEENASETSTSDSEESNNATSNTSQETSQDDVKDEETDSTSETTSVDNSQEETSSATKSTEETSTSENTATVEDTTTDQETAVSETSSEEKVENSTTSTESSDTAGTNEE